MRFPRFATAALTLCLLGPAVASPQEQPLAAGSDGVPVPKKKKHVQPEYPAEALSQGIRGIVILDLVIDTQGRVAEVNIIRSIPGLDEAAVAAAGQWEYEPTRMDGRPVSIRLTVPITFALKLPDISREEGIPELRQGVTPPWPEGAKPGGRATADVTLDPYGRIGVARILEGDEPWASALLQALRTWRFGMPPGDAVVSFRVEANFRAGGDDDQRVVLRLTGLRQAEALAAAAEEPGELAALEPPRAGLPDTEVEDEPPPLAGGTGEAEERVGEEQPIPTPTDAARPEAKGEDEKAPSTAPEEPARVAQSAPPPAPPPGPVGPAPSAPEAPASEPAPSSPADQPSEGENAPGPPPGDSADAAAGEAVPAAAPSTDAPSAASTPGGSEVDPTAPPPIEVITAAPPPLPPESGISALEGVTLEPGVPDLTRGRRPVAPPLARMARASGEVQVDFSVGAGGLTVIGEVRGLDILQPAARAAVETWTFRRTRADRLYLRAVFSYEGDTARAVVSPQPAP